MGTASNARLLGVLPLRLAVAAEKSKPNLEQFSEFPEAACLGETAVQRAGGTADRSTMIKIG
jgi:hypothetical protein